MNYLAKDGFMGQLANISLLICEHCLTGKSIIKPFGKAKRVEYPFQIVHSNICGPMNVRARQGKIYFIIFIDECPWYGVVYLISHKSEVLSCFRHFPLSIENPLNCTIKVLKTDWGCECRSKQFKELCEEKRNFLTANYSKHPTTKWCCWTKE